MPRNICLLFIAAKLNLMVLLLLATSFSSCLNDRVAELALTKKEDSDVKEQNEKESEVEELDLDSEDLEVFYPTNQWQIVHPGQVIPAGLHVQLNLQTGERLAKLPDDNNEKSDRKDSPKTKRLGHIDIDPSSFTAQELKKALAKMKESLKTDDTLEQKDVVMAPGLDATRALAGASYTLYIWITY